MNPIRLSIRRQLLAWLLIPLACLWVVFGILAYFLAIELTTYAYDRALGDSVRYMVSRLRFQGSQPELDFPPVAEALFRDDPKDSVYFQVLDPDGRLIAGDAALPHPTPREETTIGRETTFRDSRVAGQEVRIASVRYPVPGRPGKSVLVQVAETFNERTWLETRILFAVLVPVVLTVLLTAAAIWFGIRQGLAPLKIVQDAVSSRSPSDLSPLAEDGAPKEVRPLVRAINDLLARLESDIEAQRRFVANAAHQLRTPLAGLKTQTQLAMRQQDLHHKSEILEKIRTSADRCARLVNQLLVLAKLEPAAKGAQPETPVDLNSIARSATEEIVPHAVAKSIDLGFEPSATQAYVHGDAHNLFELTANLVENAVRYTQDEGKVTVRVEAGSDVALTVEDNGPGIPPEERKRVFERFYRILGSGETGSGLGLSIVSEIAAAHGATVQVADGPNGRGSLIAVRFRRVEAGSRQPAQTAV